MKPAATDFYIGLDLGQKHDFSTMAILEKRPGPACGYRLRHLERFNLNTAYPVVAQRAQVLVAMTARHGRTQLVMDLTGVGAPVFDLLQAAGVRPVAITITGGRSVSGTLEHLHVPKRILIGTLAVLFGAGRLKIGERIPHAAELAKELQNFHVKINPRTRQESYGAKGGRKHDDLVLALALAAFYAERV
jgi:phage FluMu gp28-like protein